MAIRWLDDPSQDASQPAKPKIRWLDDAPAQEPSPTLETNQRQVLEEMPWAQRQLVGAGGVLASGLEGLKGLAGATPDEDVIRAAKVSSEAAPVGAIAGEMAKYAPAFLASPAILPQMAAAGVIGAATAPEDRMMSGAVDAGMTGVVGGAVKGISKLSGNWSSLDRAKAALRDLMGGKVDDAVRLADEATATERPITTAQALAQLQNPNISALDRMIQGVGATGKESAESAQYYSDVAAAQKAQAMDMLGQMGSGSSGEASARARDLLIRRAEVELGPQRTAILRELAMPGQKAPELLAQLGPVERQYIQALQAQGQLATQAEQAASALTPRQGLTANPQTIPMQGERVPAMVRGEGGQPKPLDLAGYAQARNAAMEAGDIAAVRRADANALRGELSALPVAFTASPIRSAVAATASAPATQLNQIKKNVLKAVQDALEIVGDDPALLAEFRKIGVNKLLADMGQGMDTITKREAEAELMSIKKMIDAQLGDKFIKNYMEPYAKKFAETNRMELSDTLRQMYEDNPAQFVKAISGNMPELLDQYPGVNSIQEALGKRFTGMEQLAKSTKRDIGLKEMGSSPAAMRAVSEVLSSKSMTRHIPVLMNRYLSLVNTATKAGEMQMNKQMYGKIDKAMRDPKAFVELMTSLPVHRRSEFIGLIKSLDETGAAAKIGTQLGAYSQQ